MNLSSRKPFSIAAAIVAVSATSAIAPQAAQSLTVSPGPLPATTGVSIINFNALPTGTVPNNPPISLGGGVTLFDGVLNNRNTIITTESTPPVGSDGNYLKVRQTNATFSFTQSLKYFGLLWGSIDEGNKIEFFNSANQLVEDYTAPELASLLSFDVLPFPARLGAAGTKYIEFALADIGSDVNRVVLSTNDSPFEVDNVAYQSIPTPALLPGLIGLGIATLRKRKQTKQAQSEV